MSISSEFMNAILAMDSYNRGYNPGIDGLGGIGSSIGDGIGNATVVSEDRSSDAQDVGFYAVAYEWNGERAGVCPIAVKLIYGLTPCRVEDRSPLRAFPGWSSVSVGDACDST